MGRMKTVDLHVHSTRSDGSLSPSALVDLALKKGLAAFALTDHDTTDGLEEAVRYASGKDIEVIRGIEFSTEYQGRDIHIVGLDIDSGDPLFAGQLEAFVASRVRRNQKMCANLSAAGIDISYEKLLQAFPEAVITRAHYARYLLEQGYVQSLPEAFERYVGDRCPYFVPREKVTPFQAVELILKAKGIPVLAHPLLYHLGRDALERLISSLKDAGLAAMEAIYPTHSSGEERQMRQLAAKYGLQISGGSDFHGANKPGLELGTGYHGKLCVPYEVWERLRDWKKKNLSE